MSSPSGDPFGNSYRLLDQLQVAHMEMAGLVRDYIQLLEDLEERRDPDKLALARILPGAKYRVTTTFVRENWLKVEAEMKRLFPDEPRPES
jgi:hypothetical protein